MSVPALDAAPQDTAWWQQRHQAKHAEKRAMGRVDLVFLGDSITHAWDEIGQSVWREYYQPRNALNLGFNGDRTEHVLWRLEHGAVDDIHPQLLMLLIGTNNTGHRQDEPKDTALGIQAILNLLAEKLPKTKVLLLAIFPRSAKPTQRLRVMNEQVNRLIQDYADNERVFYLNINERFLDENGQVSSAVMADYLHPNADQYAIWAEAIEPFVAKLMGETP